MTWNNRRTARWRILALSLLAALLLTSSLAAAPSLLQTAERPRAVGAAGFTSVSVGGVTLRGTLGQPFVGVSRSGSVALSHGFWHGIERSYNIYLPVIMK